MGVMESDRQYQSSSRSAWGRTESIGRRQKRHHGGRSADGSLAVNQGTTLKVGHMHDAEGGDYVDILAVVNCGNCLIGNARMELYGV